MTTALTSYTTSRDVTFVSARIGSAADERPRAKHALTRLRPSAEHIAASRRLDEEFAAALRELFGAVQIDDEPSSPTSAGRQDGAETEETRRDAEREYEIALRQLFRYARQNPHAREQPGKPNSAKRRPGKHGAGTENTAPTDTHALTKLNADKGDTNNAGVLLELLRQAELLVSANGPAAKHAAASYLLTRLMVDLDSDVGRDNDALQTLFPQMEKVFASQDRTAKLAGARHALTRLRADGAERDDALLEVFQELERILVGDEPGAKFGAAKYALTKLRAGSDDGTGPEQEMSSSAGSPLAHRIEHPPEQEVQSSALEPPSKEGGPDWRLRRNSRRQHNPPSESENDSPSVIALALLLVFVLVLVAGSSALQRPTGIGGSPFETTVPQGTGSGADSPLTVSVASERQSADFGEAPSPASLSLDQTELSAADAAAPQPIEAESVTQHEANLYRDKSKRVGRIIARQRSAVGLSQTELALAVGKSAASIESLENGTLYADPFELLKISEAIGLDLYDAMDKLQ
ncbi:MAG: helix-turn-helix transcriptional regulator [Rhizobiaceae bacterium]|nr:helix-turn-helix transcriptional regulator [Rhizobiaceae bacterium]